MSKAGPRTHRAISSKQPTPVTLFFSPFSHSNDPPGLYADQRHYPSHQHRRLAELQTKQSLYVTSLSKDRLKRIILPARCAFASVTFSLVLLTTDRRRLPQKHGFLISLLLSFFVITSTHIALVSSSSSSSSLSSSSSSSDMTLGLLVAESCNETFLEDLQNVLTRVIEDFNANVVNPGLPPLNFNVTTRVLHPQCSPSAVVKDLNNIFNDATISAVLSLATYDIHSSFLPIAQLYSKNYFVVNSNLPGDGQSRHFSPFPAFSQQGAMLSKVLHRYRWQNVFIAYTDVRFWIDFSTSLYVRLASDQLTVVRSSAITSPVTSLSANEMLEDATSSKVIVLLMDVDDQLTTLERASSKSLTTSHAFFTFTNNPYDVRWKSLLSVESQVALASRFSSDNTARDSNIFESVFVIAPFLPKSATSLSSSSSSSSSRRKRHSVVIGGSNTMSFTSERGALKTLNAHGANLLPKGQGTLFHDIDGSSAKMDDIRQNSHLKIGTGKGQGRERPSLPGSTLYFRGNPEISSRLKLAPEQKRNFKPNSKGFYRNIDNSHLHNDKTISNNRKEANLPRKTTSGLGRSQDTTRHNIPSAVTSTPSNRNNEFPDHHKKSALLFEREPPYPKHSLDDILSEQRGFSMRYPGIESPASSRFRRDLQTYQATAADLEAVYDTVYLLASVGYRYWREQGGNSDFPETLSPLIQNISFRNAKTEFRVNADQMVQFDFNVYDFNTTSAQMETRLFYSAVSSTEWTLATDLPIGWPRGKNLPPDNCFKAFPNCDEGFSTSYIVAIVTAVIGIVVIVFLLVILFRRYWSKKEMTKGPNKVILHTVDLFFISKKDAGKGSRQLMKSRATLTDKDNTPDIIRASDPTNRSMPSLNELSDISETARYNGDLVHVKELDIKNFEMKSKLLTFIRMLRDLRHENLNPYVGFLVDSVKPSLVAEYCSRGSLYDIVHNSDFKLDWDFKASLLTDLVRGIRYLHSSPVKCHGKLMSKNCVIDSRFVLKIQDYGVNGILEWFKANKEMEAKDCLWTAPELLRNQALQMKGSEKGDIYAMAIIFQEVALRSEPYSTTGLSPEEIIKKLKKPPPLIRPSVTPQAAPPQFIQIMKQCWSEMPEMRPSIDEVYDQFKKLSGGKKANIVDTMFKMLEKYSNDLEEIVAERTMQLEEEKKKTDQLLFRMLPSTVAESLKRGQTVEAETFSEVSIYFSDIVGFTTISAMSTPMQVVDLLNDLYTMFDATIDNHDVYKVETIGDAYMVASGLPVRNGNRHAGEISAMALMLLSQCGKFTIRHMPHVPLRLRIGLHTGSCVAGVVGLTMPRFCLFGDTVNTASRMESSGAAFRIHISEATKDVLDDLGGYHVNFRGRTELKGKGKVNTYWLVGKDGFDKELPEPPPLVGGDTHGLESLLRSMDISQLGQPDAEEQQKQQQQQQQQQQQPEAQAGVKSPTKSSSAPNLADQSAPPHPSERNATETTCTLSSSQPSHLEDLMTLHQATCAQSDAKRPTSIVTADVIASGDSTMHAGSNPFDAGHTLLGTTDSSETAYQSHHSESNDSGFGSERKHSHGQEFNNALTLTGASGGGGGGAGGGGVSGSGGSAVTAYSSGGGGGGGGGGSGGSSDKSKRSGYTQSGANRTSVVSSSDVSFSNHVTSPHGSHEDFLAPVSEV